ncbi:MAG: adenylyl-sulfate reductase subunit alpha [Clostridium sp.]|jgi:adenylylsulfate reductase subunit A|uniref:adenylyl-sulfate reductase subunit alpha n=1 Tax=Clostridium sp. TaxID=1506 RepID=UPI0025C0896C|nr:adenylyl-sulfate reductase subunit alpha [Clostridium sp.]MCH3963202.1 adenylyl-sulfate reductase subunit alpha [Clostridium sp.]MCI1716335.1 adenylyl-sulfate reductase subunit alpha [Clostridium sp.]MCI1800675.1 adenylyl-sulfate reductase subunit alpha [Clostridium sp.]MCI1814670.1 adenylyl-sulfate reductase subunit alpha [Clostridium sp.]MCI1871580.1 adenylyl-sulfate reductase subunit alpha [Clostridium sp.]
MRLVPEKLAADILIIGGGTAGCFAALRAAKMSPGTSVLIAEKANIKRSGCLAAGINALNAYINDGETPESFVEYVKREFNDVIREDLVYTIAKKLNDVTWEIEKMGLPILKDSKGKYVKRGKRSVKINGENIKPILASAVQCQRNIEVLNGVNVIDYIKKEGRIIGAYAFSIFEEKFYTIYAKAVICAAGGASGLYKPNNPGFSKHKMWYSPFNTGSGYAMGIRAGAEMTSFEMRFIALRCKDTIAPTGTIAQGVGAVQVNARGVEYVENYGRPTTINRLYATVMENKKGNGPCFLMTKDITKMEESNLIKAYLNMAPSQALRWIDSSKMPSEENVEIEGTEPYIVGGHAASGYWVDTKRASTLKGLYCAGDVSGGSPKKYATGCFAEGEISADSALEYIKNTNIDYQDDKCTKAKLNEVNAFFNNERGLYSIDQVEEAMQKVMDEYAGGISQNYSYNSRKLGIAQSRIDELFEISRNLKADDCHELLFIYEFIDRLYVCKVLIEHLKARHETRWKCYEENADFPERDDSEWIKYVNSVYKDGKVNIIFRDIVKKESIYEHKN